MLCVWAARDKDQVSQYVTIEGVLFPNITDFNKNWELGKIMFSRWKGVLKTPSKEKSPLCHAHWFLIFVIYAWRILWILYQATWNKTNYIISSKWVLSFKSTTQTSLWASDKGCSCTVFFTPLISVESVLFPNWNPQEYILSNKILVWLIWCKGWSPVSAFCPSRSSQQPAWVRALLLWQELFQTTSSGFLEAILLQTCSNLDKKFCHPKQFAC